MHLARKLRTPLAFQEAGKIDFRRGLVNANGLAFAGLVELADRQVSRSGLKLRSRDSCHRAGNWTRFCMGGCWVIWLGQ